MPYPERQPTREQRLYIQLGMQVCIPEVAGLSDYPDYIKRGSPEAALATSRLLGGIVRPVLASDLFQRQLLPHFVVHFRDIDMLDPLELIDPVVQRYRPATHALPSGDIFDLRVEHLTNKIRYALNIPVR